MSETPTTDLLTEAAGWDANAVAQHAASALDTIHRLAARVQQLQARQDALKAYAEVMSVCPPFDPSGPYAEFTMEGREASGKREVADEVLEYLNAQPLTEDMRRDGVKSGDYVNNVLILDTLSKATGLPPERIHTDRHPLDMD